MTLKDEKPEENKHLEVLEEICENTRAIRRVTNRILDHLHEYGEKNDDNNGPDTITWKDLQDYDDMYL
ncbi:hypothetical protein ACFL02_07205 [Planctomycetota bacterium]